MPHNYLHVATNIDFFMNFTQICQSTVKGKIDSLACGNVTVSA